jgi:hypothetical protein
VSDSYWLGGVESLSPCVTDRAYQWVWRVVRNFHMAHGPRRDRIVSRGTQRRYRIIMAFDRSVVGKHGLIKGEKNTMHGRVRPVGGVCIQGYLNGRCRRVHAGMNA